MKRENIAKVIYLKVFRMGKNLVIVESPAKSKTIAKFLGRGYFVKASMGHVKDLPKSRLGIEIGNNFKPDYIIIPKRRKIIKELKEIAEKSDKIFLCADPDREGEAICFHLYEILKDKNPNIHRALFFEITERAVKEAIANPKSINMDLVMAQQARRVLDRLVGYLISPFLWRKIKKGLSAGRVQSVALRMICEREKEIASFVPQEYWTISVLLSASTPPQFISKLTKIDSRKPEINDKSASDEMVEDLKKQTFILKQVEKREKKKIPPPPFITSTLQQEAFRRFGFPVKKTMMIAQKLYEGVEIGAEGRVGLITYMRTDSVRVSPVAQAEAKRYIRENFSEEFIPPTPNKWKVGKSSQDAHEAIRPTSIFRIPSSLQNFLSRDELKLYKLIWEKFLSSQMSPALIDETIFTIVAGKYEFTSKGQFIKFPGFLKVYSPEEEEEDKVVLPEAKEGEMLNLIEIIPKQNFTQPPPSYTEASLVKELEQRGIGRPSTYATIISTLQERIYVIKEKGKFIPTDLGIFVVDTLVKYFPSVMDYNFTAQMEEKLDEISEGLKEWVAIPKNFYSVLEKNLKDAEKDMIRVSGKGIPTKEVCPKCGSPLVLRKGKFGMFYACSTYPTCDYTSSMDRKGQLLNQNCPLCNAPLVIRRGKFGKFIACSNYPSCNYIQKNENKTDIPCPKGCGGFIIERKSKKGKKFYTCSSYPECDYISWVKPETKS
ncbi:MAG: type I DNA topoisomerase [Candidatus Aminicenantia bacterium]